MKAAVNTSYGSPEVVRIRDVPKPQPKANEVLVRVHATTVNRTDCGMLRAHPFFIRAFTGLARPKQTIRGMDFAGTVAAVGAEVTSFRPGDRVFGLAPNDSGAHAEYLAIPETDAIATMPAGLRFDEAVVCEGAWYADTYLKQFDLKPGRSILIYGASGAIGTAAVQLAKASGATVTAVVPTRHLDLAGSLGADRVIDYMAQDFAALGETFDCVFDAVGKTTYGRCKPLLKPGATFAATDLGPWGQNAFLALWSAITRSRRVIFPLPNDRRSFVDFLKERMEAGQFRAVIDRTYPLDAIVEAYRYVLSEQKAGIVVITVAAEAGSGLSAARRNPRGRMQAGQGDWLRPAWRRRCHLFIVHVVHYIPEWRLECHAYSGTAGWPSTYTRTTTCRRIFTFAARTAMRRSISRRCR